ncbi:pyridoxal-phosphate-dependent aminotransferase family protein [Streptomyces tagetis]|uniref:Alanine--glyoxylate aminotransferase family protein n=1 Tax=Streptomyces tagetis TaxID=2820809 RepID=A0A940XDH1_9ACTN|nr:alanine--glyoxylate aminotransferase family protein [Streptomyces sp. RG38]MBQ0825167.1 alanine--glyoxylate aminotransferase family protein [Streptomyces sp. RG38]
MENVRTSGPLPVPEPVGAASVRGIVSHRGEGFRRLLGDVTDGLRPFFGTTGAVLPFTCSGTGGMEAAVVNCVAPGERVLALCAGYFGERFAAVARAHGAEVTEHRVPWGRALDPAEVRGVLRAAGPFRAVLVTHNETSTGVLNPLREVCEAVREESDALILVDGVSSVGAIPVEMDAWGADVVVTVTQKALLAQPGISPVAAGERALAAARGRGGPRYYFDFPRMADAVTEGTTTYTPAVSVLQGLDAAVRLLREEGPENVFRRHRHAARHLRRRLTGLGLSPLVAPEDASPTVTAVRLPAGVPADAVRGRLEREHGVLVAGGRGPWKADTVRIGHMGVFREDQLDAAAEALAETVGHLAAAPAAR